MAELPADLAVNKPISNEIAKKAAMMPQSNAVTFIDFGLIDGPINKKLFS